MTTAVQRPTTQATTLPATVSLSSILAGKLNLDVDKMINTIKAQCFKCESAKVTNEQMAAFCAVANALNINPLLPGMLYAYPVQGGGIVPMIGPDGIFSALASNPEVDYWGSECHFDEETGQLDYADAFIQLRNRSQRITKRVFLSEWRIASNPNWSTRPCHMLEIRAIKQCARQVIHGMPFDEDEAKQIVVEAATDKLPATEVAQQPQPRGAAAKARKRAETAAPEPATSTTQPQEQAKPAAVCYECGAPVGESPILADRPDGESVYICGNECLSAFAEKSKRSS